MFARPENRVGELPNARLDAIPTALTGSAKRLSDNFCLLLLAEDSCQVDLQAMENTSTRSVGDVLDELEWPSLEAHREQSS